MNQLSNLIDESVDTETFKKITEARKVSGRDFTDRMVPYQNFADLFLTQVRKNPEKTYMVYRDGDERLELSYIELLRRARKLAVYMRSELGIKPGDRVSTVAYNHYKTVIVYYATLLAGAVLVPINVGERDENVKFIQDNANVKAVFVMPDLLERYSKIRGQLETVKSFVHMGSGLCEDNHYAYAKDYLDLDEVLANEYDYESDDLIFLELSNLDSEALIVYTSGTTGEPKGVVLDQYNILSNAATGGAACDVKANDRAMIVLPIHHVNGLVVTLITSLYYSSSVVLNRKFSSSNYWQIAVEESATYGSVVPTVLAFLMESNSVDKYLEKLDPNFYLLCGAGPLTVDLVTKFEDSFKIKVIHGYGLSETTAFNCFIPMDYDEDEHRKWLRDYGYPSIGTPFACNDMAIHSEDGQELAENERGEIVIRGHNVMKYYFKRPDANKETFNNSWFRSGDEGFYKLDAKGRKQFFITGRMKEIIIRGGVNHATFEIDEILAEIDGVKAAMAVGFDNDAYGEEVGAYVVLEENSKLSEKDVLDYCSGKLSFAKRPKTVVFGQEFPVTATGKYKRSELKPLFAKHKKTQFANK